MFCLSSLKLEEMKTLQKLRKRQNGVSIVSLAFGKKATTEDETLGVSKGNMKFEVNNRLVYLLNTVTAWCFYPVPLILLIKLNILFVFKLAFPYAQQILII